MVCYIVINNFFVSLQISDGSYSLSQNTLRLNKRVQEMNPIFMESLIDDFINFSNAIANFLGFFVVFFLQGRLSTRLCVHSIS